MKVARSDEPPDRAVLHAVASVARSAADVTDRASSMSCVGGGAMREMGASTWYPCVQNRRSRGSAHRLRQENDGNGRAAQPASALSTWTSGPVDSGCSGSTTGGSRRRCRTTWARQSGRRQGGRDSRRLFPARVATDSAGEVAAQHLNQPFLTPERAIRLWSKPVAGQN